MSRRLFLFAFVISLLILLPSVVYAQTPTPPQQQNPLSAIFQFLFGQNTTYMDPYVKSNTPPTPIPTAALLTPGAGVGGAEDDVQTQTALNYGLSQAIKTPNQAQSNVTWFENILGIIGMGPLKEYSDQAGRNFANSILPNQTDCTQESCFQKARCAALPPNTNCETLGVAVGAPSQGPVPTQVPISISPAPVVPHGVDCATGQLTYYSQRDPNYAYTTFDGITEDYQGRPTQCNILLGGCGPVTVSMILSCYHSLGDTPNVVMEQYYPNLSVCETDIFSHMKILDGVYDKNSPLRVEGIFFGKQLTVNEALTQFRVFIDGGSTILAAADINGKGHFFWITDITPDGTIYVMDPYYGYLQPVPMDQAVIRNKTGGQASVVYKSAVAIRYDASAL